MAHLRKTEKFGSIEVVQATLEHAHFIAERMRKEDVEECWASNHLFPLEALLEGLGSTRACWTGLYRREAFCMFGVVRAKHDRSIGVPWLLATDRLNNCSREFLRRNSEYVQAMRHQFTMLVNYVDERNKTSKRWLEWLGFVLDDEPVLAGPDRMPFRRFCMAGLKNSETLLTREDAAHV